MKPKTFNLPFLGRPRRLSVRMEHYQANNSLAVILEEHGEEFCVLSVNMPDASDVLPADVFYVKHWGQEDIVDELVKQGRLVEAPEVPPAQSGFVTAKAYRWNDNPQPVAA